jgi:Tfp pilus assembly protein PilF
MRRFLPACAVLAAFLAACQGTAPVKHPAPAAPPPKVVGAEERAALDRDYFLAVGAYEKGDYAEATRLIKLILAADPANKDAAALRARVAAAQKAGTP